MYKVTSKIMFDVLLGGEGGYEKRRSDVFRSKIDSRVTLSKRFEKFRKSQNLLSMLFTKDFAN